MMAAPMQSCKRLYCCKAGTMLERAWLTNGGIHNAKHYNKNCRQQVMMEAHS